jgi:cell wall-associated NlpC family hydrolase
MGKRMSWAWPMRATAVAIIVASGVVLGTTSAAAKDPTFPTWGQVEAAMRSAAAKRAEVKKITALVVSLQGQSAAAGKLALERGEEYDQAKNALDDATSAADKLTAQADSAKKTAATSARSAGELAAQLAREDDGGDLTWNLLLNGSSASEYLDVLGTMSQLSQSSARTFDLAEQDRKAAQALSAQATVAKEAESTKAKAAKTALDNARTAADAATAKVNAEGSEQKVLTSQLAKLNGVTAATEAAYYAGVAWEAKQAAQTTPPPDPPSTGDDAPPNSSAVATAIAFARAQLGKPYRLDGSGPSSWDCSGLTQASYAAAGVYIGTHSATDQYNTLKAEGRLVPISQRQPGDILWYSDGGSTSAIKYHVTLYIGNNEMIEAPYPGVDVRIAAIRYGDLVGYAGRPTG